MSAEKETLQRVQGGLYHLQRGLAPFVEARMKLVRLSGPRHSAQQIAAGEQEHLLRFLKVFLML